MTKTRRGYKTTEFLASVAAAVGLILADFLGALSTTTTAKYGTYVALGYAVSRGLAKLGDPHLNDESTKV